MSILSAIIAGATLQPVGDNISAAAAIKWARSATSTHAVAVAGIYRQFGYDAAHHVITRCTKGFPGTWNRGGFVYAVACAINP